MWLEDIDKCEWLEDIEKEEGSLASFMACVEESIKERDNKEFEKGKVMFAIHKTIGKNMEYLDGVGDAVTRLCLKERMV